MLALDTYMDAACRAQVSRGRLAADLGVTARTALRWIHELEAAELLGVDRTIGHHVNRYQGRPYGDTRDTVTVTRASRSTVTAETADGDSSRPLTVTRVSPELEGQKDNGAGARGDGQARGEGYGSASGAQLAREAAAAARRRILEGGA